MKVLVVRLGALGDIVHTVPAVAAITCALPGARIDWLVERKHRPVLDRVRPGRRVRRDRSVALGGSRSVGAMRGLARERLRRRAGFSGTAEVGGARARLRRASCRRFRARTRCVSRWPPSFLHGDVTPGTGASRDSQEPRAGASRWRRFTMRSALPLGGPATERSNRALCRAQSRRRLAEQAVAPFASARWPRGFRTRATCDRSSRGGRARNPSRAPSSRRRTAPPPRAGDDRRTSTLLAYAALVVSGDTGPIHLAAAAGTPIVGLYGPTDPARNGPWSPRDVTVSRFSDVRVPSQTAVPPRDALSRRHHGRRGARGGRGSARSCGGEERVMEALARALARRRVTLGFVFTIDRALASPRRRRESLIAGAAIGLVGEAIRMWAAGHLEKSREVTTSGPYRFTRHPLYLGSSIMALGVAVGCRSILVAVLVFLYMASTIGAAMRRRRPFCARRLATPTTRTPRRAAPHVERRFCLRAPGETRNTGP